MAVKQPNRVILNERLTIIRRDDRGGVWYYRARVDGHSGYILKTTGSDNRKKASEIARQKFYELQHSVDQGIDVTFKGEFSKIYAAFSEQVLSLKSASRRAQFDGTHRRYFDPFFSQQSMSRLNEAVVQDYFTWRINYHQSTEVAERKTKAAKRKRGPLPADKSTARRSTLGNIKKPSLATLKIERGMLKEIFDFAERRSFIKRAPKIDIPRVGAYQKETSRRDHFTRAEMRKLRDHLQRMIDETRDPAVGRSDNGKFNREQKNARRPHSLHRYQRQVLRSLVLILANTGMRIGEALNLRWGDLKKQKDRDGFEYLYLHIVDGKTGSRDCIPKSDTVSYLLRLKRICEHTGDGDFVFQNRDGSALKHPGATFKKVLRDLDMLTGPEGNPRSLYSLRHTHITDELELGEVSIHDIALNCGTSIAYIEKHYSHAKVHQKARALSKKAYGNRDVAADLKNLFA